MLATLRRISKSRATVLKSAWRHGRLICLICMLSCHWLRQRLLLLLGLSCEDLTESEGRVLQRTVQVAVPSRGS